MPTAHAELTWQAKRPEMEQWTEPRENPVKWERPYPKAYLRPVSMEACLKKVNEDAERILELQNDWDGEGSVAYSRDTVRRAIDFLNAHIRELWDSYGLCTPIPRIGPGPNGSIDLHWKQSSWELLVNIPADRAKPATFYGDDYGIQKIRGSLNPENFNLGIAEWLMR